MTFAWWIWVAAGVLLVTSEVFIGSFIILWFGIGAVFSGVLTLLVSDLHVGLQLLFAVLSGGVLMFLFRDRCVAKNNAQDEDLYTFSGGPGTLRVDSDGNIGVSSRGTYWTIANVESIPERERIDGKPVTVVRITNNQAVLAVNEKKDVAS